MEWAEWIKQGGLAALAVISTYFFITERIARDKDRDTAGKERETANARYDKLLDKHMELVPEAIEADKDNAAALKGVEGAMKSALELLAHKAGA